MDHVYFNVAHPAGYGGVNSLHKAVKGSKKDVEDYLLGNKTYRKFKSTKGKIKRARIFVSSVGYNFQADLFDMQRYSSQNKGFRYILLVIDTFSKRICVRPLKRKSRDIMAEAMRSVLTEIKTADLLCPLSTLSVDLGVEFWNVKVKEVLEEFNVSIYPLRAPLKASLAEVSGRYLLEKIHKYFFHEETNNWILRLDDFVKAKNTRVNKSLGGLSPSQVNFSNQAQVYDSLYPDQERHEAKNPLTVNTVVNLAVKVLPFVKAYKGHFTEKTYKIIRRHDHNGIFRYTIADTSDNAEISGTYYAEELLPKTFIDTV